MTGRLARPRYVFLNAGRGAGKDILAERCVLRDALKWYHRQKRRQREKTLVEELNPLVKVWVVAPQENNLKQAWDDWNGMLRNLARTWAPALGQDESETEWLFREVVRENKLIMFGRGEIEIEKRLSSTRDALRGPGVDLVHWTEFATETVPGELDRAFNVELPGTLTRAGRLGRVYTTTTPKGPMGQFWDELNKRFGLEVAQKVTDGGLLSENRLNYYHHETAYANEFLTPEQVEQIRAEDDGGWQFQQERLAMFVLSDLGGEKAFSRETIEGCLTVERPEVRGYREISFGCDVARFGQDECCNVGLDLGTGQVVRVEFHRQQGGMETVEDYRRLRREFPGCTLRVDDTGHRGYIADFVGPDLQGAMVETQFGRQKEKWVGGLKMLMQLKRIKIPDPDRATWLSEEEKVAIRKLLQQLMQFVKVIKQSGAIEYRHPQGEHDDGVDALLMAAMPLADRLPLEGGESQTKKKVGRIVV